MFLHPIRQPLVMIVPRQFIGGAIYGKAVILMALMTVLIRAAAPPFPHLLYAAEGAGRILELGADGQVTWECPAEMARDVWRLPNGNVLFCFNENYSSTNNSNVSGVTEITRDKKVALRFTTTGQVWSCQRLADGSTLVGASSQGKLLIVSPNQRVVREIKLRSKGGHSCMRNARQIASGNFLVAEESAHAVREYLPSGEFVREISVSFPPYSAVRLRDGNTVVCGLKSMVSVDVSNRTTWSLQANDIPEIEVRWFAGIQVLPDGTIFVCNAGGKIPFFQVSREKRVIWNSGEKRFPIGHGVQLLDVSGTPLK